MSLTADVREAVASLGGRVAYIAAPDIEHHIFLSEWHKAYPEAKVIGPEGLPEKRAKSDHPNVPFASVFTPSQKESLRVDADFNADFDYEYVHAHPNKELAFFYRPDRTLIQADLMFNLPPTEQYSRLANTPQGKLTVLDRLFGGVMSTSGTAIWQKRYSWYLSSAKNRPAYNESIQRIDHWDFDRIIPCHGDVIETGGKGIFRKVFEWHLQGKKGR